MTKSFHADSLACFLWAVIFLTGTIPGVGADPIGTLRFVGVAVVPHDRQVDGTWVGGLSGLDYDPVDDAFVVVSDDRSDNAPARFYTVKLRFIGDRLFSADVTKATTLLHANGKPYPSRKVGGAETPDPESIRLDPENPATLWWISESDRMRGVNPLVRRNDRSGRQLFDMPVPPMFHVSPEGGEGARGNLDFEGLTFSPDGKTLWVAMETTLFQDGPIASVDHGAVSRFTRYDRDGNVVGQFAYAIDPIPAKPGAGKVADNGVSEILALDERRLLVLERSGVQGNDGMYVNYNRLYEADLDGATDVSALESLVNAAYTPLTKRLVLNLRAADIGYIDNLEGMSWGPPLSNGNRTLILLSDNNFNKNELTQFLAFEVMR